METTIVMGPVALLTAAEREGVAIEMMSYYDLPMPGMSTPGVCTFDVQAKLSADKTVATVEPKTLLGELFLSLLVTGG
jgi:hypothetical protein